VNYIKNAIHNSLIIGTATTEEKVDIGKTMTYASQSDVLITLDLRCLWAQKWLLFLPMAAVLVMVLLLEKG
jgi:hypothetical protein